MWANEVGGTTFAIGKPPDLYVKWMDPVHPDPAADLRAEAVRMAWARRHVAVPEVVGVGAAGTTSWLVTRALPGGSAVADRWKADPEPAVVAIGRGLRTMHDALPVEDCPWDWSVPTRLAHLQPRHADRRSRLDTSPDSDRLVVCHGDPCAPNTLVADDGSVVGHVDLANLGVADRWADLAVASWSLEWNFGLGWDDCFLDAYGIGADPERITYYRLLWDST